MPTVVVNARKELYDVFIGRPSMWGNPFVSGCDGSRSEVISKYKRWIQTQPHLMGQLHTLKGRRLGCFCKPKMCHGDVLVELADAQ